MGQTRHVHVVRFVTRATIESRIIRLQTLKVGLAGAALEDHARGAPSLAATSQQRASSAAAAATAAEEEVAAAAPPHARAARFEAHVNGDGDDDDDDDGMDLFGAAGAPAFLQSTSVGTGLYAGAGSTTGAWSDGGMTDEFDEEFGSRADGPGSDSEGEGSFHMAADYPVPVEDWRALRRGADMSMAALTANGSGASGHPDGEQMLLNEDSDSDTELGFGVLAASGDWAALAGPGGTSAADRRAQVRQARINRLDLLFRR